MLRRLLWVTLVLGLLLLGVWAVLRWLLPTELTQPPERGAATYEAAAAPLSTIAIPLSVPIEPLEQKIRAQVNEAALAKLAKIEGRDITIRVEQREPLALSIRGDTLHLSLPLKFWIRGDFKTKGKLTIFSRVKFGVAEDWTPKFDVRSSFKWDWQPRVGVWPFRFRIGDRLAPYIQKGLDQASEQLRAQAEQQISLRDRAEAGWARLHEPYLMKEEPAVWLGIDPEEVYLEPITSDRHDIFVNLWLRGRFALSNGTKPGTRPLKPLPPLRQGLPPEKNYAVVYPLALDYASLQAQAATRLTGQALQLDGGLAAPMAVELYPAGEKVAVAVTLVGRAARWWQADRGKLYLTGVPSYDAQTGRLSLAGLEYSPRVRHPLSAATDWLLQEDLRRLLADALVWDISASTETAHADMLGFVNKTVVNGFDLLGSVDEFVTGAVRTAGTGLQLDTHARGELSLLFAP